MPGQLLTLMMGLLSGLFIIIALEPLNLMELDGSSLLPDESFNLYTLTGITLVGLVLYLRRAATVEKLLPPAISAVGLLAVMAITAQVKDSAIVLLSDRLGVHWITEHIWRYRENLEVKCAQSLRKKSVC